VVPGLYVMLAVTDTGSGMSPDGGQGVRAVLYDQGRRARHRSRLSQVYGFVKQSGGHVKIYSESASGTTVKIYLPRLIRR
jgi:signal transduction histidine kinase